MSSRSRCQSSSRAPALICRPVKFWIGPVGRWFPGIHLGYTSVTGPGPTGTVTTECKMFRGASVASTWRRSLIVACENATDVIKTMTAGVSAILIISLRSVLQNRYVTLVSTQQSALSIQSSQLAISKGNYILDKSNQVADNSWHETQ